MKHANDVLSFVLIALFSLMTYSSALATNTLRCKSEGFGYQYCSADTRGGVILGEQLSDTPCQQGENWGYDRQGIWVNNGCAGAFVIGSKVAWDDFPRDNPFSTTQSIRCESKGFEYKYCPADIQGEVQLTRQSSDAACRQGENWAYDRRGIWVNNGCAGEFQFSRQSAYNEDRGSIPSFRGQAVRCESKNFAYNRCPANTQGGVRLAEQLSDTTCRQGANWGYDRRGVWVDNGCAGEFVGSSQ